LIIYKENSQPVKTNKSILLIFLLTIFLATLFPSSVLANAKQAAVEIPIYFFWGDGCPHCAAEEPFLESLVQKYPQVRLQKFEVWKVEANQEILQKVAALMGFEATGVPVTIIGEKYWIGYSEASNTEIEAAITDCIQNTCKSPIDPAILAAAPSTTQNNSNWIITLPFIGNVDFGKQWFLVIGIGLVIILGIYFLYAKFIRGNKAQNQSGSGKFKKRKHH
jgi:thiol-disulfide isomerase/thioredoxin